MLGKLVEAIALIVKYVETHQDSLVTEYNSAKELITEVTALFKDPSTDAAAVATMDSEGSAKQAGQRTASNAVG